MVTCITRTQESEPAELGVRKVPDLYRDDLAQRRIQGHLAPHREAPRFVTVSNITEADLETWERLKVSEKTRCVMFFPSFPLAVVSLSFEGIKCLSFYHFLFSWLEKKYLSKQYILHEFKVINTKSYEPLCYELHRGWKRSSLIKPTTVDDNFDWLVYT